MPRKSPDPTVSVDQAIKELLQIRPPDTLAFLLPEVVAARGRPVSWHFHNVQVRKKDLTRKGLVMDLNIEYRFAQGAPLLLLLVEHWSTARSVDLLRTAQYFLDLSGRFPQHEVVPVALVTEIDAMPIVDSIVRGALGREVLRFSTRVVQLSQTQAETWAQAGNLVAATLLMAMGGALSRAEKLNALLRFFQHHDDNETRLLFPLISEVGKFSPEEHAMTIKYLTQLPQPLFMTMFEEQITTKVREAAKLEDARRMREHGIAWDVVTDITGVKPEDLEPK
jgi:hypothetical protein